MDYSCPSNATASAAASVRVSMVWRPRPLRARSHGSDRAAPCGTDSRQTRLEHVEQLLVAPRLASKNTFGKPFRPRALGVVLRSERGVHARRLVGRRGPLRPRDDEALL